MKIGIKQMRNDIYVTIDHWDYVGVDAISKLLNMEYGALENMYKKYTNDFVQLGNDRIYIFRDTTNAQKFIADLEPYIIIAKLENRGEVNGGYF